MFQFRPYRETTCQMTPPARSFKYEARLSSLATTFAVDVRRVVEKTVDPSKFPVIGKNMKSATMRPC